MIGMLLIAAVSFVVDPSDAALKFDGYKVERRGTDFVITGARPLAAIEKRSSAKCRSSSFGVSELITMMR